MGQRQEVKKNRKKEDNNLLEALGAPSGLGGEKPEGGVAHGQGYG